jgi:hypothetical protein
VAKASRLLLEAQSRYKPRFADRLTELFATTLQLDEQLAAAFLGDVGVGHPGSYDVATQYRTQVGTRVDMRIRALQGQATEAEIWCEHKLDTELSRRQLDYPALLQETGARSTKMVAIAADHLKLPDEWITLTWGQIASMVDGVGATRGGRDWRTRAQATGASGVDRVLAEFAWSLEDFGFAVVQPLTPELVSVWKRLDTTFVVIGELLDGASRRVASELNWELDKGDGDDGWMWFLLKAPGSSWIGERDTLPQIAIADSDAWTHDASGDALVCAGVEFKRKDEADLRLRFEWLEQLELEGFIFTVIDGEFPVCYRTLPLVAVADAGERLSTQVQFISDWAIDAFRTLVELDSGNSRVRDEADGRHSSR